MKKLIITVCGLFVLASLGHAQVKIGAHGAYSNAGDIEDEDLGFGAQFGFHVNETLSMELAGTRFKDFDDLVEITTIALTARLGFPVSDTSDFYLGGGANYNIIDLDIPDFDYFNVKIDDEIGFHAAAGLEIEVNHSLQLFAEYRYTFLELTSTEEGSNMSGKDDYDFGLARVGLNLVF